MCLALGIAEALSTAFVAEIEARYLQAGPTAWTPGTRSLRMGGELVQPIGAYSPQITVRFRDSAGNVHGLYRQRAKTHG